MRKRITRIAPFQLGKVTAVLYALLSIPLVLIMALGSRLNPSAEAMPLWFIVVIPVIYIVIGFMFTAFFAWIYNVVAKWTGGIEFESVEVTDV